MTRLNSPPPPSPPGAPHPAEPPKPSYRDLSAQAERAELVFRVHSAMSASPLHWTGRAETSGFCSPNPHLALLTPGAYAAALERLPLASLPLDPEQAQPPGPAAPPTPPPALIPLDDAADGLPSQGTSAPRSAGRGAAGCVAGDAVGVPWVAFERDPSIRQSLVDHCTRRTRPSHNWDWSGPDMAADDYSSWVSCTASLRWAVWEAAHRLVHAGEAQVDVAVIAVVAAAERDTRDAGEGASAGAGTGTGRRPACQRVRAGASGEVTLAPFHPLQDHRRYGRGTGDRGRMTNSEKEAVANAVYMAHSSDEVLFYGRIFAGSVRANLTFTREHLPLTLPHEFFASSSPAWVDDLVWNPLLDSYDVASKKIKANAARFAAGAASGTASTASASSAAGVAGVAGAASAVGAVDPVGAGAAAPRSTVSGSTASSRTPRAASAPSVPPAVAAAAGGWGAPPYAQPSQPATPATPAPAPATPATNHYATARSSGSVPPSFLSSTNAVPLGLGRRGRATALAHW